jgi:two-component system response regulator MprA
MRRHGVSPDAADRLRMDPIAHAVSLGERRRTLSPIEYKLLARLLADPNEIVRRRHLREAGWPGGGIVAENTLDQYLSKIRRKVAELDPAMGVRSVRGIGYRIERRE